MKTFPFPRPLALAWGGVATLATALSFWVGPRIQQLPACPFHVWTGLPCPACGSGRALAALARFDLGAALAWNPLAVLAMLVFLGIGWGGAALALTGRMIREPRDFSPAVRLLAVTLLATNWLYLVWAGR